MNHKTDYHQQAIATIFWSEENLKQVIDDVIYNFEPDGLSFPDAMAKFFEGFEVVASELVAAKVLGVDLTHYYVRTGDAMCAAEVESFIDGIQFKEFDQCVNRLFDEIDANDYVSATKTYRLIYTKRKRDVPELTKVQLNEYLEEVWVALDKDPDSVDFHSLCSLADKLKQKNWMDKTLPAAAGKAGRRGNGPSAPATSKLIKI